MYILCNKMFGNIAVATLVGNYRLNRKYSNLNSRENGRKIMV